VPFVAFACRGGFADRGMTSTRSSCR